MQLKKIKDMILDQNHDRLINRLVALKNNHNWVI